MSGMKLYFSPGACSLSPHIALREAGLDFEIDRVDFATKKTSGGADFLAINPKGLVPTLVLDNGEVLTEGPAIVQYIADLRTYRAVAMDVGDQDGLRGDASALHDALEAYGLAHMFEIYPGTHTSKVADRFQNHVMPFFSRSLCAVQGCREPRP